MYWSIVIIVAAAALAAAVLFGVWWLWWRLPKRQAERLRLTVRDPKARADIEDNFRKTIGQLIGGTTVLVGAGAGAVIAYLQLSQQQQASRDLLISNQVAKGFEQLGSKEVVVRLGGIYALEGVMNTSEQYDLPVLEALSGFVRDGTRTENGDRPPATDIQAALTVIGRRAKILEPPDLTDAHLPQADLYEANLIGATLIGTHLSGADLIGANLTGADLFHANLFHANLRDATLDSANLTDADLRGATVTQAQLDQACGTNVNLDSGLKAHSCATAPGPRTATDRRPLTSKPRSP